MGKRRTYVWVKKFHFSEWKSYSNNAGYGESWGLNFILVKAARFASTHEIELQCSYKTESVMVCKSHSCRKLNSKAVKSSWAKQRQVDIILIWHGYPLKGGGGGGYQSNFLIRLHHHYGNTASSLCQRLPYAGWWMIKDFSAGDQFRRYMDHTHWWYTKGFKQSKAWWGKNETDMYFNHNNRSLYFPSWLH